MALQSLAPQEFDSLAKTIVADDDDDDGVRATVLNALKVPPGGALRASMSILQNQEHGLRDPYDVGQEAVLFLKSFWDADLAIAWDNPGLKIGDEIPAMAFLIRFLQSMQVDS